MGSESRVGPVKKPSVQRLAAIIANAVVRINCNHVWRETIRWFNEANVRGGWNTLHSLREKVLI